jgi:hypothetical protein
MVNQVRNLRSTKWDDHEMVKVIFFYNGIPPISLRNRNQTQFLQNSRQIQQSQADKPTTLSATQRYETQLKEHSKPEEVRQSNRHH